MVEYITKESALKALGQIRKGFRDMDEKCVIDSCILEVMSIYPSDVVEVVRCKDCKFGYLVGKQKESIACPYYDDQTVDPDHFCSHGEQDVLKY